MLCCASAARPTRRSRKSSGCTSSWCGRRSTTGFEVRARRPARPSRATSSGLETAAFSVPPGNPVRRRSDRGRGQGHDGLRRGRCGAVPVPDGLRALLSSLKTFAIPLPPFAAARARRGRRVVCSGGVRPSSRTVRENLRLDVWRSGSRRWCKRDRTATSRRRWSTSGSGTIQARSTKRARAKIISPSKGPAGQQFDAQLDGAGSVCVTGHFGNWELFGARVPPPRDSGSPR